MLFRSERNPAQLNGRFRNLCEPSSQFGGKFRLLPRILGEDHIMSRLSRGGKGVSARALVWIIAGHMAHHVGILRERYGVGPK